MSRFILLVTIVCLLLPLSSFGDEPDTRLARLARQEGKPMVAQFGDGQCPPCILQETYIKKVKKKLGDEIIFEFAHVRDEFQMTRGYKVWTTPTLLFIDSKGVEAGRYSGLMKPKAIKAKLVELGWVK